ncbi:MAG: thioredoxin, partial [Actinobacteria bacterium]|nr:thioredoxin [Actinomycetota bacterium]
MVDATDASFQIEVVEASKTTPVVVDLWAPWCEPCKSLGPIIEMVIAETQGQVKLVKVNVDENPQISAAFQVQSIPAVFAIVNGQVVDNFVGAKPEGDIRRFVAGLMPNEADVLASSDDEE